MATDGRTNVHNMRYNPVHGTRDIERGAVRPLSRLVVARHPRIRVTLWRVSALGRQGPHSDERESEPAYIRTQSNPSINPFIRIKRLLNRDIIMSEYFL